MVIGSLPWCVVRPPIRMVIPRTITTPSLEAQVAVYRSALAAAGVDARSVGMVEAHGPGTSVGDPIEYGSLARVYGADAPCALASVKTNFGHTQSAAGALGLMKAILALQHGKIPPNLHFTRLPDDLARIDTQLSVPQSITPWPTNGPQPRLAAVSSYGWSGTNVHAVVEQAPAIALAEATPEPATAAPLLFPLSSTSADELRRTASRLADWVHNHTDDIALPDLAYTLARRRAHRPVRAAVIASSLPELSAALHEVADGDSPHHAAVGQDDRGPVWVFSGQGSQWAAMGADLLATEPTFAEAVAEAEPLIARESGFSVTEAMSAPETVTGIERVQPAIFTMQVALAATMKSYGVRPGAVVGHSLGEAAAAVVAGALSLEDGVRVICRRSRLMSRIAGAGAMASVELPAQQVFSELMARGVDDDVVVAVVASPQSTVIGGATQTVREVVAAWEQRDIMAREVAVDVASHSPQVDPILDDLTDALAELRPMTPEVPYYSATLFDPRERPVCDAYYWADNLRHTVRFAAAVQAALEDGYRVFAELSPHPLLTHAVEQTARSLEVPLAALAAMRREQALPHGLRDLLADLHCAGAAVDFSVLYPAGRLVDTPLPTWTHRPLLLSRGRSRHCRHAAVARFLCTRCWARMSGCVRSPSGTPGRRNWAPRRCRGSATIRFTTWPPYPGLPIARWRWQPRAPCSAKPPRSGTSGSKQMLLLDKRTSVGATASVRSSGVVNFVVETDRDGERVRRASALLHAVEDAEQPPLNEIKALLAAHPCRMEGNQLRQWFDERGIQYGPGFTGLTAALTSEEPVSTVLAEVNLPGSIRSQQDAYGVHPALLDACFQSVAVHPEVRAAAADGLLLPLGVRRLRVYGPTRNARLLLCAAHQS